MLDLTPAVREALWSRLCEITEDYWRTVGAGRVTPPLDPADLRRTLAAIDFAKPVAPETALAFLCEQLSRHQVHTPHPRYFGLYNPAPAAMGIFADAAVAAFNPQLAAWSHSPFAVEAEFHLLRAFGAKFGWRAEETDGAFTSGGAEANHTAVLVALAARYPEFAERGARVIANPPVLYTSSEVHHSFLKAARMSGIGLEAIRTVAVDGLLRMDATALRRKIERDRYAGFDPFLIVATAGTTNAGAIDPLPECAAVARDEGLWLHVDAAWGGAAILTPELSILLNGIERADSITFDAHKWMSVPMGAGMYLTRHAGAMDRAFRTPTSYMPKEAEGLDVVDPHLHTMQWSRRFIGAKLLLSLMVAGWEGYGQTIRYQTAMGGELREELRRRGWTIRNETALPVVCFSDPGGADPVRIAMHVVQSGEAWISTTRIAGETVLRACITNYRTSPSEIEALGAALDRARSGELI